MLLSQVSAAVLPAAVMMAFFKACFLGLLFDKDIINTWRCRRVIFPVPLFIV